MSPEIWKAIKDAFAAAIELSPNERYSYVSALPTDQRADVEKLLANYQKAQNFIEEPIIAAMGFDRLDEPELSQIDEYRVIEQIGAGGMGTVYLAEPASAGVLHRVALKLIKRGMDTSAVLKRFYRERQILAELEHPNIARFIDAGSAPDGRPYFVMEYVDGSPIKEYCDRNELSTRGRLELFRKVCEAVSFAHRNLVVHRDLKPSNILVAATGEPKLLDFGIAKLLQPDWSADSAEATVTMLRAMTPEYASPEQLQGKKVTTATDVYSLGVVLYELLTGERPFRFEDRSAEGAARELLTLKPEKPSSIVSKIVETNAGEEARSTAGAQSRRRSRRELVGDIDNITLKALHKDTERRYASVEEFSEDIRRHLAGLPVSATADTVSYRAVKFAKRHRTGVAAAAIVSVTLIAATAITGWQAYVADRERARAERRFDEVRKLANTVLFEYHDGIAKLPGATAIRAKMLEDTVKYLDGLSSESGSDIDLMREVATAYEKVGGVQGGDESLGVLGRTEAAEQSYLKALKIRSLIAAERPASLEDLLALAICHRLYGDVVGSTGDFSGRLANYEKAIDLHESLVEREPSNPKYIGTMAAALFDLGYAHDQAGDNANAMLSYVRAIDLWNRLRSATHGMLLSKTHKFLGGVLEREGRRDEAINNFRASLEIDEERVKLDGSNMQNRLDLSVSYIMFANTYLGENRFEEAKEFCVKSLEIRKQIAERDPENVRALTFLARAYATLGQIESGLGDHDRGAASLERAIDIFTQPKMADPAEIGSRNYLAEFHRVLATTYETMARKATSAAKKRSSLAAARKHFGQAYEITKFLKEKKATTPHNKTNLEETLAKIGSLDAILAKR